VKLSQQPQLAFDFRARDVSADAIARNYATGTQLPPIGRVNATGKVTGPSDRALVSLPQITLLPPDGGSVTGSGTVKLGDRLPQLALNLTANNVPGNAVARTYASVKDAPIDIGLVTAQANISGTSENLLISLNRFAARPRQGGSITGSGTVRLQGAEPQLALTFQADELPADSIARAYVSPQVLPPGIGRVTGRANLTGTLKNLLVSLPNLAVRPTDGGLVTGSGTVRLRNNQPQLALSFEADNVQASRIARSYVSPQVLPFGIGAVSGRADLSGSLNNLLVQIPNLVVRPSVGGVVTGNGSVRLAGNTPQLNLNLAARGVSGAAIARAYNRGKASPIELGTITANAEIAGSLTAPRVVANATVPVQDGMIRTDIRADAGRWQAKLNSSDVRLAGISPELRGVLNGDLTASGRISSFRPRDVRVQGQVRLSEGVALINRPLTADLRWDGQKVIIDRAVGPGFGAAGFLYAKVEGAGAPALTGFDLNVRTRDLSLQAFDVPLPVKVPYSGDVDFNGRVRGTPTAPKVAGDVALKNFVLNNNKFESPLLGTIRVDNGVNLDLNGQRDRIALTLSPTYRPIALELRSNQIYAKGTGRGDLFTLEARNLPLAVSSIPGTLPLPVSGVLNTPGLTVNLKTFEANGQVAIANPAIGGFQAKQFTGFVGFAKGVATLKDAQLTRGETTVQVTATANIRARDPEFTGQVTVARGRVQDVLELLQVFDLSDFGRKTLQPDYGTQADLQTTPVALDNATILAQLQRLAEVKKLSEQAEARRQQAAIPSLQELQGYFNAEITASGSLRKGVTAKFDVRGQNWQWRNYMADQVIASGSFENGVLTLLPVRLEANDAVITFSGQVLGTEQSGQFRMINVPIAALKDFAVASVGGQAAQSLDALAIDGKLNATATISGRFDNPQVLGDINLADGLLNGTSVQSAQGSFQYGDARLDFGSNILITGNEPIRLSGSLPYRLPFATVTPKSGEIALDVNIRNEGLTLLNLLNNQVAWQGGQGEVQLKVRGDVLRPQADGFARIEKATLSARALPEPLTNVNGLVRFETDRLTIVEKIEGQFSKGQVSAVGVLPIVAPFIEGDRDFGKNVTVGLDNLNLNLKGLYRGAVNGRVEVLGTALTPQLTGVIRVSDGEVLLAQANQGGDGASTGTGDAASTASPVEFRDLRIELGDRLRVTSAPILNFIAVGDLTLNGTLNELRPKGVIRLTAGQVNLFTTQFTIDRAYPQFAEFVPGQGLDPNLNVRLIASVPETTGGGLPTSGLSSEIAESAIPAISFGGLQTVRVQAQVDGPASQIFDNLVLSSSPRRSESEIVSLIGGGFVQTLGRGDSLLGIANLAGSALLTNFQTIIGNALGLSEFRLFPTLIQSTSKNSRASSSTLGLAAEAAIDITPTISFSTLKILTTDDPAQFGVRYRLNDRTLLRGSTDFSGDSRFVIEYEARF
jgi:translocation and assembly module TamB